MLKHGKKLWLEVPARHFHETVNHKGMIIQVLLGTNKMKGHK